MDWAEHIAVDPAVLVGKPVVRGTRLAVDFILRLLADGWSEDDIIENYPVLTRENIRACLAYSSVRLGDEKVYPVST